MRILYFSDNTSDHNRRFLEKLIFFGHQVHFLNLKAGLLRENWLPRGVEAVPARFTISSEAAPRQCEPFVPEFKSWLKHVQPDVIHAGPVQTCGYIAALSNFHPLVVMSWGSDLLLVADRSPEHQRATQIALRAADGFCCDCHAVRTAARRFAEIPEERIAQFPWGIKRGCFGPDGPAVSRQRFGWGQDAFVLISTRSWEPVYGTDALLEAFRRAHGKDDRLRLLLLGDGSENDRVHRFIADQGLSRFVAMPGAVASAEMPHWFRGADSYASCAWSDGTSVSLLEAMATGLPAIVTDLPSNREWITEGENGFLAGAGSPEEFAVQLLRAASLTPIQRQAISERNQSVVAERADWDRNFPRLLRLYETLVTAEAVAKS